MEKRLKIFSRILLFNTFFAISTFHLVSATDFEWREYPSNPIIFSTQHRTYYPSIIRDGTSYLLYSDYQNVGGVDTPAVYRSDDGIIFNEIGTAVGLSRAGHTRLLYDENGFGEGGNNYKIFYWDLSVSIYTPGAIRTAVSANGINWQQDEPLTGNYITGVLGDPNMGTYGPSTIFYNEILNQLDHNNSFNNRYVMYHISTSGGQERNMMAYSLDGKEFYAGEIALDIGGPGAWDANYASRSTVIKIDDTYHMWYSGGVSDSNDGIGYANSSDGLNFTRYTDNPILTTKAGTWHSQRTYTPEVIFVPALNDYYMFVSGRSDAGNYTVGLYIADMGSGQISCPSYALDGNK